MNNHINLSLIDSTDSFLNLGILFMFLQVILSPKLLKIDEDTKDIVASNVAETKLGLSDMFKNPEMRLISIVMFINWIVVTLGYYGISMGAANLGGNVFVSNMLLASIEIPAHIFCMLVLDYWGRKPVFVWYD